MSSAKHGGLHHEIGLALLLSRALVLYIHEIGPSLLLSRALEMYVSVIGLAVVVQGRELYITVEFYGAIGNLWRTEI